MSDYIIELQSTVHKLRLEILDQAKEIECLRGAAKKPKPVTDAMVDKFLRTTNSQRAGIVPGHWAFESMRRGLAAIINAEADE